MVRNSALQIAYLDQRAARDFNKLTGPVLHIRAVTEALEARGHSVRHVAFVDHRPQWSDDLAQWTVADAGKCNTRGWKLFESGVRGVQARLNLPYANWFDSQRFAQGICSAASGVDVLYERSWIQNMGGMMAAKQLGVPIVLEFNGDVEEEYEMLGIQLRASQRLIHEWIGRQLAQADHIVTVSEPLRSRMMTRWNIPAQRITAVNNGAKVNRFAQPREPKLLAQRYGIAGDDVVVFVGSMQPWHACDVLIESFAKVVAQVPTAHLLMVGDGPVRGACEQQADALGIGSNVTFTGHVDHADVPSLMAGARVAMINPKVTRTSVVQSQLKLFEYMAAGCATVAPSAPNVTPIVEHGKTGWLFAMGEVGDSADTTAISNAIAHLLQNPTLCAEIGEAAQQQALKHHSWDAVAASLEEIFYPLIDKKRRTSVVQSALVTT